jgi:RND superfamily putative drug exporter
VLAGWLLAVVAIIGLAQWAGSRLDNNFALAGSPSQQAQNLLAARFPAQKGDSADVVLRSPSPLSSPANAAAIGALVRSVKPLAHVSGVQSPLAPGAGGQLSPGHRIGFVVVQFDATAADLPARAVWRVIDTARGFARPGLQVAVGGAPVEQVISAAPGPAEMIGLVAAVVIMLLAFGSVVAMGLPILTALAGLGVGFGMLMVLSHLVTVPTFGPDMMIMIGLGVGIDYALFVVTRYRQGLAERRPPRRPPSWPWPRPGAPCCSPGRRWSSPWPGCSWWACRSWTAWRRRRSSRSPWCWWPRSPCCLRSSASPGRP